jgi:hypothetical protein
VRPVEPPTPADYSDANDGNLDDDLNADLVIDCGDLAEALRVLDDGSEQYGDGDCNGDDLIDLVDLPGLDQTEVETTAVEHPLAVPGVFPMAAVHVSRSSWRCAPSDPRRQELAQIAERTAQLRTSKPVPDNEQSAGPG